MFLSPNLLVSKTDTAGCSMLKKQTKKNCRKKGASRLIGPETSLFFTVSFATGLFIALISDTRQATEGTITPSPLNNLYAFINKNQTKQICKS